MNILYNCFLGDSYYLDYYKSSPDAEVCQKFTGRQDTPTDGFIAAGQLTAQL